MTSTPDYLPTRFDDEYVDLRVRYYERNDHDALDRANAIADLAYESGTPIDEIGLDERARLIVNNQHPLTTR